MNFKIILTLSILLLICLFAFSAIGIIILFTNVGNNIEVIDEPLVNALDVQASELEEAINNVKTIDVNTFDTKEISLNAGSSLNSALPSFINFDKDTLTIKPGKYDVGTYTLSFIDQGISETKYIVNVKAESVNSDSLKYQINNYLGSKASDFGIYIYDNSTKQELGINDGTVFGTASIIKVPYAILLLRDVDNGSVSLDDTFPVQDSLKFSNEDTIGALPEGTELKLGDYLENMISESSNTALNHLDAYLGRADVINMRINNELKVNLFFNYPQITTAANVGKVMTGILNQTYLKKETNDYLISLMANADPDLKTGIGNGLPEGTKFVNKVGFYDTTDDLAYQDSAIVWGEKKDYVLVIMDRNIDWDTAIENIRVISQMVYNEMEK